VVAGAASDLHGESLNRRRAANTKIRELSVLMLHAGKKYHAITPLVAVSYRRHVTSKGKAKRRKRGAMALFQGKKVGQSAHFGR
jgi:hypothetical protein